MVTQSTYVERVLEQGSGKYLVRQMGKIDFDSAENSSDLSTVLKYLLYGSLQPISATYSTAASHLDDIYFYTASVENARTVNVRRRDDGQSSMQYWYELIGY